MSSRDGGSLEGPHHPPPVTLHPGAREQRAAIERFALRIASSRAVDPRYDRGVAIDFDAGLEELDRFDHALVRPDRFDVLTLRLKRAGASGGCCGVVGQDTLEP